MKTASSIERFIATIQPFFGIAFDFDDTLACTEYPVACVSADFVRPFSSRAVPPSPADFCRDFVGLGEADVLKLLADRYEIQIPAEQKSEKSPLNARALRDHTLPIPGGVEVLEFVHEFKIASMILTSSRRERIETAAKAIGIESLIALDDEQGGGKIRVLSSGVPFKLGGTAYSALPGKPSGDGYRFVARALSRKLAAMFGFEDSTAGMRALSAAAYGGARRCLSQPPLRVHRRTICPPRKGRFPIPLVVPVFADWRAAMEAALSLGLSEARARGLQGLPSSLPDNLRAYLENRFQPVQPLALRGEKEIASCRS